MVFSFGLTIQKWNTDTLIVGLYADMVILYRCHIKNIVFHGHIMVDVGASSGILSMFAVQATAKNVYVVEAIKN